MKWTVSRLTKLMPRALRSPRRKSWRWWNNLFLSHPATLRQNKSSLQCLLLGKVWTNIRRWLRLRMTSSREPITWLTIRTNLSPRVGDSNKTTHLTKTWSRLIWLRTRSIQCSSLNWSSTQSLTTRTSSLYLSSQRRLTDLQISTRKLLSSRSSSRSTQLKTSSICLKTIDQSKWSLIHMLMRSRALSYRTAL